jgi:hypothetical protein
MMKKNFLLYNLAYFYAENSDHCMDDLRTEIWIENDGDETLVYIDIEVPGAGMVSLKFSDIEINRIFGESGELWALW